MDKTKIKIVLIALVALFLIGQNKCQAQDFLQPLEAPGELAGPIQTTVTKLKFKDKHPRWYKLYRGGRFACHVAEPFLRVGSYVFQIMYGAKGVF